MDKSHEESRAAFEAWFAGKQASSKASPESRETQWRAWQAGRNHTIREMAPRLMLARDVADLIRRLDELTASGPTEH